MARRTGPPSVLSVVPGVPPRPAGRPRPPNGAKRVKLRSSIVQSTETPKSPTPRVKPKGSPRVPRRHHKPLELRTDPSILRICCSYNLVNDIVFTNVGAKTKHRKGVNLNLNLSSLVHLRLRTHTSGRRLPLTTRVSPTHGSHPTNKEEGRSFTGSSWDKRGVSRTRHSCTRSTTCGVPRGLTGSRSRYGSVRWTRYGGTECSMSGHARHDPGTVPRSVPVPTFRRTTSRSGHPHSPVTKKDRISPVPGELRRVGCRGVPGPTEFGGDVTDL